MATDVNFGTQQYFGFDPRTIPGCGQWLDAADTRTITTNGTGKVTAWTDKSGAGASVTPLGTNSNATIEANYRNGLSAINFAGLNQYQSPANKGVYPSDVYILVALKSLVRMDVISIGPTTADNFNSLTFGEHTALRWHNGSTGFARTPLTVSPTNETSTSLLLMNWSIANNNFVIRRNGIQLSSTTSYTFTPSANPIIQIGFRHQNQTTSLAFNAYVAEVITYNRQIALAERQQVEGYLAWKWGLVSDLSTTHPYRYTPPAIRAFQPPDIAGGALLWLDAADTRTITGSPVTQWRDKSGRGSNAVTGLGSVVAGTAINSLNTLRFGLSTTLNLSNFIMPSTQTSVFYVFRGITVNPNTSVGTGYFVLSRTADNFLTFSGNQQFFCYQNPSAGRSYVAVLGSPGERNWGNLSTTAFCNVTNVISTTGISYASSNGLSLPLVGTAVVSNTSFTSTTYQISTSRNLGDVYTFDLGELIVCDGTLSTSDAQRMEGYLAWKWGVPRSLPTTHPYYNVLPSTVVFTPPQLAGLVLWLDALDPSTLFSDTAGTTRATAGGTVARWNDKSVSSNYVSQATVGNRPTLSNYTTSNVSYTGLYFPSSTTNLTSISNNTQTGNLSRTLFCVLNLSNTSSRFTMGTGTHAGGTPPVAFGIDNNPVASALFAPYVYTAADNVFSVQISGTQYIYAYYDSAVSQTGGGYNFATSNTKSTTLNTAATPWYIGTRPDGAGATTSFVSEVIVYNSALTRAQRQQVEGYLAWKWGVQRNLPSSHPYSWVRA